MFVAFLITGPGSHVLTADSVSESQTQKEALLRMNRALNLLPPYVLRPITASPSQDTGEHR